MWLFLSILYCIQYILNIHFVCVYVSTVLSNSVEGSLNYLLMFRICISWATTRSKEGWIIFHIKPGINNKYLNQATDSWLRIPGEVSDLIYAAHCFTDWKYLNLNTVQRLVTRTSQRPLIAESPISSSNVTMCPSIPPPPLSPNLTSIIQISYTLYCLHNPDDATNWIHGHGTMEQNIYFQTQNCAGNFD